MKLDSDISLSNYTGRNHLVYIHFDSRFHHLISLMHFGMNFDVFSSKYSNLILALRLKIAVVLFDVLTWYQPPTGQTPLKKLASVVKGPIIYLKNT